MAPGANDDTPNSAFSLLLFRFAFGGGVKIVVLVGLIILFVGINIF
jgi:hypothetical protein